MTTPLRVLIVEDSKADAELLVHALGEAGFAPRWQRVEDEESFLAQLQTPPELILADYSMPQFDALRALALVKENGLDVPFIVVSGSIGEETAVGAMRLGASDYLFKDRLARLGEAIKQALEQKQLRDEKRRMERALKDYLSMLAHELRNPLAPILTSLEVVRHPSADDAARRHALDTIGRSARHLARLVDDLLEATRISQGRIQLRLGRMDLARAGRLAAADRARLFEQAGVTLTVQTPQTPVWVMGDETRLAQVLHNLLDNALRFSEKGGSVRLNVAAENGQASVTVQDTGLGIEPELLSRLFQPFAQAERNLHRPRGGLGLGLLIVKTLVELHRGEVGVSSPGAGCGATFVVRLPLEPEPAALSAAPEQPKPPGNKLKILVVEDNHDAADSLKMLLEFYGHEVSVAYNGPDGVARAVAWQPDAVLCDIGLPGLDGFGVATALRADPATAGARLIALTGYVSDEDRRRSRAVGFDEHLGKPADPEKLLRELAGG